MQCMLIIVAILMGIPFFYHIHNRRTKIKEELKKITPKKNLLIIRKFQSKIKKMSKSELLKKEIEITQKIADVKSKKYFDANNLIFNFITILFSSGILFYYNHEFDLLKITTTMKLREKDEYFIKQFQNIFITTYNETLYSLLKAWIIGLFIFTLGAFCICSIYQCTLINKEEKIQLNKVYLLERKLKLVNDKLDELK